MATCSDQIYARMELIKSMKQALVKQTADALKHMDQPAAADGDSGRPGVKGRKEVPRAAADEPAAREQIHDGMDII